MRCKDLRNDGILGIMFLGIVPYFNKFFKLAAYISSVSINIKFPTDVVFGEVEQYLILI